MAKTFKAFMICTVTMLLCLSCAKKTSMGTNYLEKQIFDSWIALHYPGVEKTTLGCYIIEDEEGSGELVGEIEDSPYLLGRYILRDLDGTIQDYTDAIQAKQLGIYDSTDFFGPHVWKREDDGLSSGVEETIKTMKVGGRRKVVIPGWLNTTTRYDTEEEYLNTTTGESSIYDITIVDIIQDIVAWEIDSTEAYVKRHYPGTDSTSYGFYYIQTQEPTDTTSFDSGTEVYFNYIGRLLNGTVFDTNIKDTAKFYGLYNTSTTYEEQYMTWADAYTGLTMGSSSTSVIEGFAKAIFNMRTGEKGTAVFYSPYGYDTYGGGSKIPSYSPLRFDFELIGTEED